MSAFPRFINSCLIAVIRLVTIMREEGPAALYKGFVPKVLRLAPGGGILLLVVEFTLGVFRKGMFDLLVPAQSLMSTQLWVHHTYKCPLVVPRPDT